MLPSTSQALSQTSSVHVSSSGFSQSTNTPNPASSWGQPSKQPLPRNPFDATNEPDRFKAYEQCLTEEKTLLQAKRLPLVRVAGWLLHRAPSTQAQINVARMINEEPITSALTFGMHWKNCCIRLFRTDTRQTPMSSISSQFFTDNKQEVVKSLKQASPSHKRAKYLALERDRYRCLVTGVVDTVSAIKADEANLPLAFEGDSATFTECAHIISGSVNAGGTTLNLFIDSSTLNALSQELAGKKVHSLTNVMTLASDVHSLFDSLQLWFEPYKKESWTPCQQSYQVVLAKAATAKYFHCPAHVTFVTDDPEELPLPSARYLELHAACAKVAHLSGAADYIDEIMEDIKYDGVKVLATDGTSGDLFDAYLVLSENRTARVHES